MMKKYLDITLIIEGQVPFRQRWSIDTTFEELSDQIVDQFQMEGNTSFNFYSSRDELQSFQPQKTFLEENLQTDITLYGLVLKNGLRPNYGEEELLINIIIPQKQPLRLCMLTDTTFHQLSDQIIYLSQEFDGQISYTFYHDEQNSKIYDSLKTLKEENIQYNQDIYGLASDIKLIQNSQLIVNNELAQQKFIQSENLDTNNDIDFNFSQEITIILQIEGQAPFKQKWSENFTFQELSNSIVEKFGQKEDISYIFYSYSDRAKRYEPIRTFKEENLQKIITIYGVLQHNGVEQVQGEEFYPLRVDMPSTEPLDLYLQNSTTFIDLSIYFHKQGLDQSSCIFYNKENQTQIQDLNKSLREENTKHIQIKQEIPQQEELLQQNQGLQNDIDIQNVQLQPDEFMDFLLVKNDRMSQSHKELKENMKIQLLENQGLKKQLEETKNQMQSVYVLIEEVSQWKLITGVQDQVQIQKQWTEYYNEKPELYDYAKAFYWTLINCFDAYRIANTGALQQNLKHLTNTNTNKIDQFMDIFQYGSKILSYVTNNYNLPVLKNVTEYIDNIVGTMYDKMKEKRYDDRIMAINRIICLNNDSTAQTSQQQSRMIEMAALEIAKRKKKILYGQMLKDMLQSKTLDNNEDFINKQMEKLYSAALGNRIYLFTTMAGREAVKDVTLLLIYLTLHHETIIEESKDKKLYQIIADCVVEDKTLGIMNKMEVKVTIPVTQKQPNRCIIM